MPLLCALLIFIFSTQRRSRLRFVLNCSRGEGEIPFLFSSFVPKREGAPFLFDSPASFRCLFRLLKIKVNPTLGGTETTILFPFDG